MSEQIEWTEESALSNPAEFLTEYIDLSRKWQLRISMNPSERDRFTDLGMVLDDVTFAMDDFNDLLDFLRLGLSLCEDDWDVGYFTVGPIETLVHSGRLKRLENLEVLEQVLRVDPRFRSALTQALLWTGRRYVHGPAEKVLERLLPLDNWRG